MVRVGEVFIPGGQPESTYVTRDNNDSELTIKKWSAGPRTQLLSVHGPTKTGKTVLLHRYFPDAAWLSGGIIESAKEFWEILADKFEIFADRTLQVDDGRSNSVKVGARAGATGTGVSSELTEGGSGSRQVSLGRSRPLKAAVREYLEREKPVIILDDFHYMRPEEQVNIVRGMKDMIYKGVGFIVLAVPHRAYDVMRVEREMTGRLVQAPVGHWDNEDLRKIATQGFNALNLGGPIEYISERLALESFSSPYLMQQFCLDLCQSQDIYSSKANGETIVINTPEWDKLFRQAAQSSSKLAFDELKKGPRQRSDRKMRMLKNNISTDIYGVVLAAIEHTGPQTQLVYEDLRAAIRDILEDEPPQRHELTRVLDEMTKIAKKMDGEPVLEYDDEVSTLWIADPFFAFYLRHAKHDLRPS